MRPNMALELSGRRSVPERKLPAGGLGVLRFRACVYCRRATCEVRRQPAAQCRSVRRRGNMSNESPPERVNLPLTENGGLKVELVPMPSGDNPWRTRGEYLEERNAQLETLRSISRTSKHQTIALIVSMVAMIATCIIAGVALLDYLSDLRASPNQATPAVSTPDPSAPSTGPPPD